MVDRVDETWHRLREWTAGQAKSERLAAQILFAEGFMDIDPSHPLGGKDGGKDAICKRSGVVWAMGVYFPRGQQSPGAIERKLIEDASGARSNGASGLAFVTNQELRLAVRESLKKQTGDLQVELYHLERIAAILDRPGMASVRRQYLAIESEASSSPVLDKWVGHSYVQRIGLDKKLKAGGYRFAFVTANKESERVDIDGWEYVEVDLPDSSRARLKIKDAPIVGGYVVLLKKKEGS